MRNPCNECEYYHKENNTCQNKCRTGHERFITLFDRLFCKPYRSNDRVIWTRDKDGTVKPVVAHFIEQKPFNVIEHDKQIMKETIEHIQKYVRLHTKYADKPKDDYILTHDFYEWLNELKEK